VEAETEEAAKKKREEILKRIHAALLGTNTKAAADADGAAELERDAQIG
jgi:hypothetical protein